MTLFVDTGILSIAVVGGIGKVSKMTSRHISIAENVTFQVSGSKAADIADIAENVTFQVSGGSSAADRSSAEIT